MSLKNDLLEILVCPRCKGHLLMIEAGKALVCEACHLKYVVHDGVPDMVASEAVDLRRAERALKDGGALLSSAPIMTFKVIDGPSRGMVFHLEKHTCRAIGRALTDTNRTTMFNVDLALTLDDSTKGLVQQYVSRQFRKSSKSGGSQNDGFGYFRRASDIVIEDTSISRLHAMLFYDDVGVGILDLVSKNGTYVNGGEVESHLLRKGDAIEFGETKIIFEG